MAEVKIPVTLEMKESEVEKICELVEGDGPQGNKVAFFTQGLVIAIAKGAMLIPVETVEQFQDINPDLDNPESLLEAVGQGAGVVNGEMIIRWPTDPALIGPLRDRAETNGVSVQQLIKDILDTTISTGWFYDLSAHVRTLFVTPDEAVEIGEILGKKDFNAADVMEALRLLLPEQAAIEAPEEGSIESIAQ